MTEPEAPSSTSKFCQICLKNTSIYTCPRCLLRTCSLACSKQHKTLTRCTGERNKAGYIPMNQYTEGKFLDDFSWLEEGRRKVESWGKEIDERKLAPVVQESVGSGFRGGFRGRGRGRGGGARDSGWSGQAHGKETKLETLQRELAERGIDMRTLPEGMEKRRLNQSSWDAKTKAIHLSVQTIFHLRPATLSNEKDSSTTISQTTSTYLLPRCPLSSTLAELYDKHPKRPVGFPGHKAKKGGVAELVDGAEAQGGADIDMESASKPKDAAGNQAHHVGLSDLIFVCRAPASALPITLASKSTAVVDVYFPPCPPSLTLEDSLDGQSFVEYPSLDIWLREDWDATVAEGRIVIVDPDELEEAEEEARERERIAQLDKRANIASDDYALGFSEPVQETTNFAGLPKRPAPDAQGFDDHMASQSEHKRPEMVDSSHARQDDMMADVTHQGHGEFSLPPRPAMPIRQTGPNVSGGDGAVSRTGMGGGLVDYGSSDEEEGEI